MTTAAALRDDAARILRGQTDAGDEVFTPSDWATWDKQYPVILLSVPHEEKTSFGGRGEVEFLVVATLRIVARVEMPASPGDLGALQVEHALQGLKGQIERLLINNPALICDPGCSGGRRISQFPFVRSQIGVSAEGEGHLAELMMDMGLEFYQGPEDFWDPAAVPLKTVQVTLPEPAGTPQPGLTVNF